MRRQGFFFDQIGTYDNFLEAFCDSSKKKKKRRAVIKFSDDLEKNLTDLLNSFKNGTFKTSDYSYFKVIDRKERLISKLPYKDHILHWAILNCIEDYFVRSFTAYTYAGIIGRGPHKYAWMIQRKLKQSPEATSHYLLIDVKQFYPSVYHSVIKTLLRAKMKDRQVLEILFEIIDSIQGEQGLPIGTKLAQFFSNIVLSPLDHHLKRCFDILKNPVLVSYYTKRYIEERINTAKTETDYKELSMGVSYLAEKFKGYLKRIDFCFRLADDVLILHNDTVFLHFLVEWVGLFLSTELKLTLNHKWRIDEVDKQGIDSGGYIHFHTHILVRKKTKQALCRDIARLRKKGIAEKEILTLVSSRLGFVKHADCQQLLKKLGMETEKKKRLGQKIKDKRTPWPDLSADRKRKFEDILFDMRLPEEERGSEADKMIELIDYKIEDSKIETEKDGTPKPCLVIRYRWQGEEWFSFTGSSVLIDMAQTDFSKEDLPADTVITVYENKQKKKFYKFT